MLNFGASCAPTREHVSNIPHKGRSWFFPAFVLLLLFGPQVPANGAGTVQFGDGKIIDSDAFRATGVLSADLDGDGDQDLLSSSYAGKFVRWYDNEDGTGTFSEAVDIANINGTS